MNDIVINKINSIQKCIKRACEEYKKDPVNFDTNYTLQDASILNILRACENSIDLANHILKKYKLGIPKSSTESFKLLSENSIMNSKLSKKLQKMVQFRNIAIHQYQELDLEIVKLLLKKDINDLLEFTDKIMKFEQENELVHEV